MTHTAGFNAGVEAAVTTEQAYRFLECAVRNWSLVSFDRDGLEDFRIELERFRQKAVTDGLKRPEPSEGDVRKIGMAMRDAVWNVCKGPTLSDELTDEQYAALFRAALKAMGGE